MAGWTIMATPSIYYITSNCCLGYGFRTFRFQTLRKWRLTRKVPFFSQYAGLLVAMISALFDMSPGLLLLFKLGYQHYQADLVLMLTILTSLSSINWLRTFFLMPGYIEAIIFKTSTFSSLPVWSIENSFWAIFFRSTLLQSNRKNSSLFLINPI